MEELKETRSSLTKIGKENNLAKHRILIFHCTGNRVNNSEIVIYIFTYT